MIGLDISFDEKTLVFKVSNVDKIIITYNNEGGGFKADDLWNWVYTYYFFLSNQGVPKEYTLT